MTTQTTERLSLLLLAVGLTLGAALFLLDSVFGTDANRELVASCHAASARLDTLERLHADPQAGDGFDLIASSLAVGLGYDTPEELAGPLKDLRAHRTEERERGRSPDTDAMITGDLARARKAVYISEARAALAAYPRVGSALYAARALENALLLVGISSLTVALARRGRERALVAAAVGCPAHKAHTGALHDHVALYKLRAGAEASAPLAGPERAPLRPVPAPTAPARPVAAPPRHTAPLTNSAPTPAPLPPPNVPILFTIDDEDDGDERGYAGSRSAS